MMIGIRRLGLAFVALVTWTGCARRETYTPIVRDVTITAVPLLSKELVPTYPFLEESFGKAGVLEGKEAYAFIPSTIVVVAGDTIHFHLLNPEDDPHSFSVSTLSVAMPPQSNTSATLVAGKPGIYTITCVIPSHSPVMWGQLIVLSPSAVSSTP